MIEQSFKSHKVRVAQRRIAITGTVGALIVATSAYLLIWTIGASGRPSDADPLTVQYFALGCKAKDDDGARFVGAPYAIAFSFSDSSLKRRESKDDAVGVRPPTSLFDRLADEETEYIKEKHGFTMEVSDDGRCREFRASVKGDMSVQSSMYTNAPRITPLAKNYLNDLTHRKRVEIQYVGKTAQLDKAVDNDWVHYTASKFGSEHGKGITRVWAAWDANTSIFQSVGFAKKRFIFETVPDFQGSIFDSDEAPARHELTPNRAPDRLLTVEILLPRRYELLSGSVIPSGYETDLAGQDAQVLRWRLNKYEGHEFSVTVLDTVLTGYRDLLLIGSSTLLGAGVSAVLEAMLAWITLGVRIGRTEHPEE